MVQLCCAQAKSRTARSYSTSIGHRVAMKSFSRMVILKGRLDFYSLTGLLDVVGTPGTEWPTWHPSVDVVSRSCN